MEHFSPGRVPHVFPLSTLQLMHQVPLEAVFRHLLGGGGGGGEGGSGGGDGAPPPPPPSPRTVLQVFAVCSSLVAVLQMGLTTYGSVGAV